MQLHQALGKTDAGRSACAKCPSTVKLNCDHFPEFIHAESGEEDRPGS